MSIPTPFNPLGTLGGGGIERLEFVTVDGTTATANKNLIAAALGADYFIEPHDSASYYAEVYCSGFGGRYSGATGIGPASVGEDVWNTDHAMCLVCYIYKPSANTSFTSRWCGKSQYIFRKADLPLEGAFYKMQFSNGKVSAEWDGGTEVAGNLSWSASDISVSKKLCLKMLAGVSYKFHALKVVTESQSFEAAPARKGGKDGIAFYIDGKFESFLEL